MKFKPEGVGEYLADGCGRWEFDRTGQCKARRWHTELALLRQILQSTALTETLKWSAPCYTVGSKNILMLSALKDSVVVSFFNGVSLEDRHRRLEKPGENSRYARYLRFRRCSAIRADKALICSYAEEAIALSQKSQVAPVQAEPTLSRPMELQTAFDSEPDFKAAFEALTPGRQRGYLLHFNAAKQSVTRQRRIEKCKPAVFAGKGWNEYDRKS